MFTHCTCSTHAQVKPGKGPAFVRTTLKNLETGKSLDKTWRAGEAYIEAQVEKLECQAPAYIYIL